MIERDETCEIKQILSIAKMAKGTYYGWKKRMENGDRKRKEKQLRDEALIAKFIEIVEKVSYIPGKRGFKTFMFRHYDVIISIRKAKQIMKMANLIPTVPTKDPYKGQATHYHECASIKNSLGQEFKEAPRHVILTDITYLNYGADRAVCYLATFKDAFTSEILGHAISMKMDVALIKEAYDDMMKKHRSELIKFKTLIHSDQGSQYLSYEYRQLLKDEGLIQSMSRRANSQDNAPQESFFSRMKYEAGVAIAHCVEFKTVKELVGNYMTFHNEERYQWRLAGLSPKEYYLYRKTGIYPLKTVFGIPTEGLIEVEEFIQKTHKLENEKKEKRRAKKLEAIEKEKQKTPLQIICRDQEKIRRTLRKWKKMNVTSEKQIVHLNDILEQTKAAAKFVQTVSKEIYDELINLNQWQQYTELQYVINLGDVF